MSRRISKVIDRVIPIGVTEETFRLPGGNWEVLQVVFDRTTFEDTIDINAENVKIQLYADGEFMGGATWAGGRIDGEGIRPGRRMLWSAARWPLPKNAKDIRAVATAPAEFHLILDVDLF